MNHLQRFFDAARARAATLPAASPPTAGGAPLPSPEVGLEPALPPPAVANSPVVRTSPPSGPVMTQSAPSWPTDTISISFFFSLT